MQTKEQKALEMLDTISNYPEGFANDILGIQLWEKQLEIIESVKTHKRTAVKSCNSAGKTKVAAFIGLWFVLSRPEAIVVLLAPRLQQIITQVFAEVSQMYNSALFDLGGELKKQSLWVADKSFIICTAIEAGDKSLDSLRGWHADEILFIGDESSGISEDAISAVDGSLSTSDSRLLLISNPQRRSGAFFNAFNKDKDLYNTISISKDDVLNSKRAQQIKGLGTKEFYEEIKTKYGEHSGEYKIKALGEFPDSDDEFSLIPEILVHKALQRDTPLPLPEDREDIRAIKEVVDSDEPVISVDVAGEGKDHSVIVLREGLKMRILKTIAKNNSLELAGEVKEQAINYYNDNKEFPYIAVDNIGIGAGVYDLLRNDNDPDIANRVIGVHFGERAERNDLYFNKRAEAYALLKQFVEFGCIQADNDNDRQQFIEMSYIQYTRDPALRIKLERKDEVIKRLGRSPDLPDALAISLEAMMVNNDSSIQFTGVF